MNVLEKILEEIERTRKSIIDMSDEEPEIIDAEAWFDYGLDKGKIIAYDVAKEIIRSHMDGISKTTDVQEVEGIDVDNAIRILKDMQSPKIDYAEMVGAPAFCYGKRYVFQDPEDYAIETALAALNEKKERDARRAKDTNIIGNDGWIPVEERSPNQNGVYNVTRLIDDAFISDSAYFDGQDTWHNDNRVNHARPYLTDIVAWQPLPEPYKLKKQN